MKPELNIYELVLFFKVTLTEEELKTKIDRYQSLLTTNGSQVMIKIKGKTSLAYPIKKFDTALHVVITYLGNGALIKQMNTEIQRDESILRAITTKLEQELIPTELINV